MAHICNRNNNLVTRTTQIGNNILHKIFLIVCVNKFMPRQYTGVGKSFITNITFVGFLSSMHSGNKKSAKYRSLRKFRSKLLQKILPFM